MAGHLADELEPGGCPILVFSPFAGGQSTRPGIGMVRLELAQVNALCRAREHPDRYLASDSDTQESRSRGVGPQEAVSTGHRIIRSDRDEERADEGVDAPDG